MPETSECVELVLDADKEFSDPISEIAEVFQILIGTQYSV